MPLRSSVLPLLSAVALALLAGCATTQQPGSPEGPPPAPPPREEPVTNPPPQGGPSSEASPWRQARVGDRVVYAFSANRSSRLNASEVRIAGQLALEVVAVQAPWVWMK